jgi:catechol 2,3-dioxygenase-like lactoylglutathione lyase family enzyme
MASQLTALCIDARDPGGLARFWSGVLGWEPADDPQYGATLRPSDDTGFRLRFVPNDAPKAGPNQYHFDLTSGSLEEQQETVARVLELGGRHLDIGQGPDVDHVVMADPEGNELCVIEPGNGFLADCGFVGALSGDGSPECGYFWSRALGWPLVWDQDEETAIRSLRGGPKVTWGGPPYEPKVGKERVHLDLAPAHGGLSGEVDRLLALGASRVDIGQGDVDWVVLADPDGHEFCVKAPAPPDGS